jgi:hypothetical protein
MRSQGILFWKKKNSFKLYILENTALNEIQGKYFTYIIVYQSC